ncbi:MAG: argininosuccinate lyase [Haliscomenobacter sp.]|nr:argininosuccinate lyase [Haliscomenobacter sp.]
MKLWQKDYQVLSSIETFTVGRDREMDLLLAPFDILGSLAHIRMLSEVGLLDAADFAQLEPALRTLYREAEQGKLLIEEGVEDIHSQVELLLTRQLGEAGKKIHSGRSRNDQVLVDLRLFFRAEIQEMVQLMETLFNRLQGLSEDHKDVLLPGYTHFQVAMPSSFGLWFGAYAESLADDLQLFHSAYQIINQNPLGSAAGYGSSFPLNRRRTTELLGFGDLNYNVVHAQMGRGKSELILAFGLSSLAHTLGKLAMDVVLFLNQNFGFISFPDELTTGSSIMPHKKNPDVFELIRARCNHLQTLPGQVSQLTGNLPSGYHRDFQLLKEVLFPALESAKACIRIAVLAFGEIQVKPGLLEDARYAYLFSVEEVNRLVLQGIPFRDAYRQVGEAIASGHFHPRKEVAHTHEGSIGNLCTLEIKQKWERIYDAFPFEEVGKRIQRLAYG